MDDRVRVFGEIISDQTRLSIVEMLYNEGPLRWMEIMDNLESQFGKVNPNKLRFHLNFMLKREAILKETEHEGSRDVKYFRISDWMKELLERVSGKDVLSTEKIQEITMLSREQYVEAEKETTNEVKKSSELSNPPSIKTLIIDPEFEALIYTIESEERNDLFVDILERGCLVPIVTWNNTIIDGHNRYKICRDNNIPFKMEEMQFEDRDAAKIWIITNQIARRNLSTYRRFELVKERERIKKLRENGKRTLFQRNVCHSVL